MGVEEQREKKLKQIDDDFKQNIRHGKRLGPTPQNEAFMSKPEFQRHANKTVTAPSTQMNDRRGSLNKMIHGNGMGSVAEEDGGGDQKPTHIDRKQIRSISVTGPPRRLSYIGALTTHEEKNLANLYVDSKGTPKLGVVPEPEAESGDPTGASAGLSNALDKAEAEEKTL